MEKEQEEKVNSLKELKEKSVEVMLCSYLVKEYLEFDLPGRQ